MTNEQLNNARFDLATSHVNSARLLDEPETMPASEVVIFAAMPIVASAEHVFTA